MKRGSIALLLPIVAAALLFGSPGHAYNQPPLNFGLTDALDGAVPGPGTYFFEYIQAYQSDDFRDKDGNKFGGDPKVGVLLSMNQLAHISTVTFLEGNLGVTFLQPIAAISASGNLGSAGPPVTSGSGVLGDFIVGPFIQWFPHKLLGRPFLHRFEIDFTLPTGQYDRNKTLNPGANIYTIEPFYALTWFLTPEFSTSWRLHYTYNGKNDKPWAVLGLNDVTPGSAFHANYSFEYEVVKNLRLLVAGYYLKQLSEDKYNGVEQTGTKEQVFAVGPGVHWITKGGLALDLKTAFESSVENRPSGNRTTFRMVYKF